MPPKQSVIFSDLGQMGYLEAWDLQENLLRQNVDAKIRKRSATVLAPADSAMTDEAEYETSHYFLMVEHPPVLTLGKSGHMENVLTSETELRKKGIEFFKTNRGGDITFHGPGQIVGYPILDLEKYYTDIGLYLRSLEELIMLTLAEYGLKGERSPGETGVWLDAHKPGFERKICAMSVRCSRWVTMHGFAFNVNTSLDYFDHIVPCGIKHKSVTSLKKELGFDLSMEEVKGKIKSNFEKVFNCELLASAYPVV